MSSRTALAFSFLDRYVGLLLSVASSMIVARLLSPAEIGVFSIAMVVLSFISAMRDLGAGQYLVQERELTTERIRATWTVQLGLGIGFALIVLAGAVPVAHFYGEPRLREIMFVLALNFAISPFGSLTYAWLMREMRFDSLAMMRFAGGLTGAIVSVLLAWRGFGPISLAVGNLAATIANALIAVAYRPASFPWLPGFGEVRRVLSFGTKLSITTVVNTLGNSVAELVLGKAQNMVAVGLYSRANGLTSMFNRLILDATHSVAMPLFSKASREGKSLGPILMKATGYVTGLGWSFFGVMVLLAHPMVRVLYGDQWDASVPLVRLIALAMAIGLPSAFCATTLLASGSMDALMRLTTWTVLQYSALLAIGALFGTMQLGWAIVVAATISTLVWLAATPAMREVPKPAFAKLLLKGLVLAAASVAGSAMSYAWHGDSGTIHLLQLATGIACAALVFVATAFAVSHPLADELRGLLQMLQARRLRRAEPSRE